jgi:ABC-type lipopolysaccharide export system ATPase subunit
MRAGDCASSVIASAGSPREGSGVIATVTGSTGAVRTEGHSKRYGQTLALDDLDLLVQEGEVYGYLGPNGAGKTHQQAASVAAARRPLGRAVWAVTTPSQPGPRRRVRAAR